MAHKTTPVFAEAKHGTPEQIADHVQRLREAGHQTRIRGAQKAEVERVLRERQRRDSNAETAIFRQTTATKLETQSLEDIAREWLT